MSKLYRVWYSGYVLVKAEDEYEAESYFDHNYDGGIDNIEEITPDNEEFDTFYNFADEA